MDNIQEFDTIILLSGDSDFAPIIRRIKERGKHVIVVSAKNHISRELISLADKYLNLKIIRERIEFLK